VIDLVVRRARVVTEAGVHEGSIGVDGGRIAWVGGDAWAPQARQTIDAREAFAIPGFIDSHVHLRGGREGSHDAVWAETFASEGAGAVHGGVTTLGVFSWSEPGQPVATGIESMRRVGPRQSPVDFFAHAVLTRPDHVDEIPMLADELGCWSFKHFFNANKARPGEDSKSVYPGVENELLFRSCEAIRNLGGPAIAMAHCEDQDIIWTLQDRLRAAGRNDLRAWAEARPGWVEHLRMRIAWDIARAVGVPLYIVHVAAAEGVELLAEARQRGEPLWGETCPHYLTHTAEMEAEIGNWGRVNTAIKSLRDQNRLWAGIRDGSISNMGTDHSTFPRSVKEGPGGKHQNIWNARSGIIGGLEHWLPVMMTFGVLAGRITIEEMVRVCSTNNAKAFGLYPRKGTIRPGADADIVLIDPEREVGVSTDFYRSSADWTIYEGWTFRGLPTWTIAGGEVVMADGELVAGRRGRYLVPGP
jgi:dihydropyrimidinase/dihydroorotase